MPARATLNPGDSTRQNHCAAVLGLARDLVDSPWTKIKNNWCGFNGVARHLGELVGAEVGRNENEQAAN
jgi:hypothetical protein